MKRLKNFHLSLSWVLVAATPVFLALLYLNSASSYQQFKILALAAVTYLTAASWYHFKDKTLTFEIIIEYILIAALALVII